MAAYYVGLSDRIRIDQAISGGQLVDQARSEQSTQTLGLEATGRYKFTEHLNVSGTLTYQDHEITTNQTHCFWF